MSLSSYRIPFLIPYFVETQRTSFFNFLTTGLIYELSRKNPMYDSVKQFKLVFYPEYYQLSLPEYTAKTAILKFKTYGSKLYVPLQFTNHKTKELNLRWVVLGNLPLMTKRGNFVVNGSPRVIINQIVRSPGIYYKTKINHIKKKTYYGDLISQRGAWLRLVIDKKKRVWVLMKKTRKIPVLVFLKALGITDRKLIESTKYIDFLEQSKYETVNIKSFDYWHPPTIEGCLLWIYGHAYPQKQRNRGFVTLKRAKKFFFRKFFSHRTYDLGCSGRNQLNKKFGSSISPDTYVLTPDDLVCAVDHLIRLEQGIGVVDDIDHLKNRRVRTSGELIQNQFGTGFIRLEKFIREKTLDSDLSITTIVSTKPVDGALREFFGSSPLSQFMDQTNPLAELTHKRRISSLGPGGITRETAGMAIRGIHPSHYGRICPIETPEGRNAGLVNSITTLSRINSEGGIETPFYNVYQGQMQKFGHVVFFSAAQEESITIAPSDLKTNYFNFLPGCTIPVRASGDFKKIVRNKVEYMSVSPIQMISIATSLIPFLEHDDANRALMGSNMQRQAVPLVLPERPAIGTGLEGRIVCDSGHSVQAKASGFVSYISSKNVLVSNFQANYTNYVNDSKIQTSNFTYIPSEFKFHVSKSKKPVFAFSKAKTNRKHLKYQAATLKSKKSKSSILPSKPIISRKFVDSDITTLKTNLSNLQKFFLNKSFLNQNKHTHLFSRQTKRVSIKKIILKKKFHYIYNNKKSLTGVYKKQYTQNNFMCIDDLINPKTKKDSFPLNKNFTSYKWGGFTKSLFFKDILTKHKKEKNSCAFYTKKFYTAGKNISAIKQKNVAPKAQHQVLSMPEQETLNFLLNPYRQICHTPGFKKEYIFFKKSRETRNLPNTNSPTNLNPEFREISISKTHVLNLSLNKPINIHNLGLWIIKNTRNIKNAILNLNKSLILTKPILNLKAKTYTAILQKIQNVSIPFLNQTLKLIFLQIFIEKKNLKHIFFFKSFNWQNFNSEKFVELRFFNTTKYSTFFRNSYFKNRVVLPKKSVFQNYYNKNVVKNYSLFKVKQVQETCTILSSAVTYNFNVSSKALKKPKIPVILVSKNLKSDCFNLETMKNILLLKKYKLDESCSCAAPWVFQPAEFLEPWVSDTKYALNRKKFLSIQHTGGQSGATVPSSLESRSIIKRAQESSNLERFALRSGFELQKYTIHHLKQSNKNSYYLRYNHPNFVDLSLKKKNTKLSYEIYTSKIFLKNTRLKKNSIKHLVLHNKIKSFKLESKFHFLKNTVNYSLLPYQHSNQNTCIHETPLVSEEEWVQKGDLLADGSASVAGELALGKSILVAYMPWEGYNFEDAILVNERLIYNDVYTSIHIEKYKIEISDTQYGRELITCSGLNISTKQRLKLDTKGIVKLGSWVTQGDVLVGKLTPILDRKKSGHQKLLADILGIKKKKTSDLFRDTSLRVPKHVSGRIVHIELLKNDNLSLGIFPSRVHIYIAEKKKIQVGDKISGRHGNKGIISTILPRQDMPYLADGTPIDMVLNPLGVPSRMNVGQIFECLLGLAAKELKEHFKISCFDEMNGSEASRSLTYSKLFEARLKTGKKWLFNPNCPGKMKVFDGRTGECFHQNITVGQPYMLKLVHLVDDKIHARATGPYSLVTQQPLRGRSKHGGQRLGEMEVWALEGFGAAYTLQELLTIKSDDIKGRHQVMQAILDQNSISIGTPESFKVLLSELQSLCLDMGAYCIDNSGNRKRVDIWQLS